MIQAAEQYYIRLAIGNHDLAKRDQYERTFRVDQIELHPDFRKSGPYSNDIALIKVRANRASRVMFNTHVQPICLPKYNGVTAPGSWCVVTGWGAQNGKSKTIRFVNHSHIHKNTYNSKKKKIKHHPKSNNHILTFTQVYTLPI